MAFIKTEKDVEKDKKVTGKGVDYIAKELDNIRADYSKKLKRVNRVLGLEDNEDANLSQTDISLNENINNISNNLTNQLGGQTIESYSTGAVSMFTWSSSSNASHTLVSSSPFILTTGCVIINMWWKISSTWILMTPTMELATSYGMNLNITNTQVKLYYRARNSHMAVRVGNTTKQLDNDATHYMVNIIKIT
tara:strand:+ start:2433 stop:3011 length:579 start_codon:yes stop_codon:yes gene_type:complete